MFCQGVLGLVASKQSPPRAEIGAATANRHKIGGGALEVLECVVDSGFGRNIAMCHQERPA